MARHLMSVFGPAEYTEYGNYPNEEAMKQAFADTEAFNQRLQKDGYWVLPTAWRRPPPRRRRAGWGAA